MKRRAPRHAKVLAVLAVALLLGAAACHDSLDLYDAGVDAGKPPDATLPDATGTDTGVDAPAADTGLDAPADVPPDTRADAGADTSTRDTGSDTGADGDAGADAGSDAGSDAGADVGPDADTDAGPDADTDGSDGGACPVTTFAVTALGSGAYVINGSNNPTLAICRGMTFTFNINASGHPFWLKSVQGASSADAYNDGVTNNGVDTGTITWVVSAAAPTPLFYNCEIHGSMTGQINLN